MTILKINLNDSPSNYSDKAIFDKQKSLKLSDVMDNN